MDILPAKFKQYSTNKKLQLAKTKIGEAKSSQRDIHPGQLMPVVSIDQETLLQEAEDALYKVLEKEPYHKETLETLQQRFYQEIYFFMADYDKYRNMNLRINPHDLESTLLQSYFKCINISLGLIGKYPETKDRQETFLLERIFVGADILFFDPYEFFLSVKDGENTTITKKKIFYELLISDKWRSVYSKSPTLRNIISIERGMFETSLVKYERRSLAEGNVFQKRGAIWEIVFESSKLEFLQDRKGMGMIAYMLETPYKYFHVQELKIGIGAQNQLPFVSAEDKQRMSIGYLYSDGMSGMSEEDKMAIRKYKEQIDSLEEELQSAIKADDDIKAEQLQKEIDQIQTHLKKNYYKGKSKNRNPELERVRKAVAKNIDDSRAYIGKYNKPLAKHLSKSIRKGYTCSYSPEKPVNWVVRH